VEWRSLPESAGIQLAEASAILVSNSMEIPMESAGIWQNGRNPGASQNSFHWNPLEFRPDSMEFQWILSDSVGIPKECIDCTCYYNIKNNYMSKD
jgi:hypothetical protein